MWTLRAKNVSGLFFITEKKLIVCASHTKVSETIVYTHIHTYTNKNDLGTTMHSLSCHVVQVLCFKE